MTEDTADSDGDDEPSVLVVDDESDLADLYVEWLASEYTVHVAYDGETALDRFDPSIDVVLLDRRMPDLPGDDVLDHIRDEGMDCRVAMVTAVEPDVDIVEMGFDDYLQKPVNKDELLSTVDRLRRRSAYDTSIQSYFSALTKRALLDQQLDSTDRTSNVEYRQLEGVIESLESDVDDVVSEFDDDDFEVLFHRLN